MKPLSELSDQELQSLYASTRGGSVTTVPRPQGGYGGHAPDGSYMGEYQSEAQAADAGKIYQAARAKAPGIQGMSDDELKRLAGQAGISFGPAVSTAEDVAKSFGTGVAEGTIGIAGTLGDVNDAIGQGASWLLSRMVGSNPSPNQKAAIDAIGQGPLGLVKPWTSGEIQKGVEDNITGEFYEPQTTAGRYANTLGEFTPGIVGGGGTLAGRAAAQVALPALASEAAGQAVEGVAKGTWMEPAARAAGALAGGLAPAAARKAISPMLATDAERAKFANFLRAEGVDVSAGQATGSKGMRNFESEVGSGAFFDRQGEQFTKAALRRAGIRADRASPEVIEDAYNRIGKKFDDLSAKHTLGADKDLASDLASVQQEYHAVANPLQRVMVDEAVEDIVSTISQNNGTLPGGVYQKMASRLARRARGAGQDNELREALYGLREALDDAMERAIASSSADDLGAWKRTRRQYRNMLVIESAATAAGENAALGMISPSGLRNATLQKHGRRNYATGKGDFAELARAGEALLKAPPNSGTAGRTAARNLGQGTASLVGAALGGTLGAGAGAPGIGIGTAAGAVIGGATPGLLARAALSPVGRKYLSNQAAAGAKTLTPGQLAFLEALAVRQEREGGGRGQGRE